MAHYPVNHPLRPLYRALAAVAGLFLVLYGVVGLITVSGGGLFGHPDETILGLGGNLFASIVALLIGAVVLAATALGRNVDTEVNRVLGWALLAVGSYELATSRTDANFLDFTIGTVIVVYLVGLMLILSGLYTKTVRSADAGAPRQVREGRTA
ncbi:DUF4383 domain-containing protein [Actinoplanes sp. NPDC049265]|uniref:DUF4383 domain-containing protein n=1 Tax=Actinoplanes sp. NPDC049265 TaxID=3363902 RepID=UPI00371EB0B1